MERHVTFKPEISIDHGHVLHSSKARAVVGMIGMGLFGVPDDQTPSTSSDFLNMRIEEGIILGNGNEIAAGKLATDGDVCFGPLVEVVVATRYRVEASIFLLGVGDVEKTLQTNGGLV